MRLWTCTRGASALEFALIAPLMLLMVFGTIEYSRLLWTQHVLQQSAIATARCMAIPQLECAVGGAVDISKSSAFAHRSAQQLGVLVAVGNIELKPAAACHDLGGFSVATLTVKFDSPAAGLVPGLPVGKPISATACYPNYQG